MRSKIAMIPIVGLLLAALVLPTCATEVMEPDSGGEQENVAVVDSGGDVSGSESTVTDAPLEPVGPTELDYLVSINTYLTYLFGFGLVLVLVLAFVLLYKFFNMFF